MVVMSDGVEDSTRLGMLNVEVNNLKDNVTCETIDWHRRDERGRRRFDVVLGSDVLFVGGNVKPVVRMLRERIEVGGIGIITDPGRVCAEGFEGEVKGGGMECWTWVVEDVEFKEGGGVMRKAVIYVVTRKVGGEGEVVDEATRERFKRTEGIKEGIRKAWMWIGVNKKREGGEVSYTDDFDEAGRRAGA